MLTINLIEDITSKIFISLDQDPYQHSNLASCQYTRAVIISKTPDIYKTCKLSFNKSSGSYFPYNFKA